MGLPGVVINRVLFDLEQNRIEVDDLHLGELCIG